jgi:hypothetical protein
MLVTLWAYTGFAEDKGFALHGPDGKKVAPPPPLALREATEAESGRIKGDALRMGKRIEASHLQLIAPYVRGSRDPQLLAALGLEERAAGHDERARKFLEAAAAAKTTRARAYLDLARLRYADAQAKPAGAGGLLDVGQLREVLTLLGAARSHPPPLSEVYDLIVEAWAHSAVRPTRENFRPVDEGAQLFPEDSDLIYADAQLRLKVGLTGDAAAVAEYGERYASNETARERFRQLLATIHPPKANNP